MTHDSGRQAGELTDAVQDAKKGDTVTLMVGGKLCRGVVGDVIAEAAPSIPQSPTCPSLD